MTLLISLSVYIFISIISAWKFNVCSRGIFLLLIILLVGSNIICLSGGMNVAPVSFSFFIGTFFGFLYNTKILSFEESGMNKFSFILFAAIVLIIAISLVENLKTI